jgi:hypothetical protein
VRPAALTVIAALVGSGLADPVRAAERDEPKAQADRLAAWYRAVEGRREAETFGTLVARAAVLQRGRPYSNPPDPGSSESLRIELDTFHCVSFLESSLAVARCLWNRTPSEACFLAELESQRYRKGKAQGFASRLHYLDEWISDNAGRRRLTVITAELGGSPIQKTYFYMSRHPALFPALGSASVRAEIEATEARLTASPPWVLGRERLAQAQARLQEGDLVAIASSKPGILLTHAGIVVRGRDGRARLLHASSHHRRVVLTSRDLSSYVLRRPERRGVVVARPLAPETARRD